MKRTYNITNIENNEVLGKFAISLSKTEGLTYDHISGISPCWKDLVAVVSTLFATMKISSASKKYVFEDCYTIRPDNKIDIRFIPVLINTKLKKARRLPLTIDENRILEHYFHIPFSFAVRSMLALSMSYGEEFLELDGAKIAHSRYRGKREEKVEAVKMK